MFIVKQSLKLLGSLVMPLTIDCGFNSEVTMQDFGCCQQNLVDCDAGKSQYLCYDLAETCHDAFLFHWFYWVGYDCLLVLFRKCESKVLSELSLRIVAGDHQNVAAFIRDFREFRSMLAKYHGGYSLEMFGVGTEGKCLVLSAA